VVVVLRDPRAIWASRLKAWPTTASAAASDDEDNNSNYFGVDSPQKWAQDPTGFDPSTKRGYPFTQSIQSICDEQREFIQARERHGKQLVHIVRYIDLVRKPLTVAKGIYKFNFLPPIAEVEAHIEKHTTGDCEHLDKPFSVCRNTKHLGEDWVDVKWKDELSDEVVELINEKCSDIIEYHERWETAVEEE
jgi:hypothetical protein